MIHLRSIWERNPIGAALFVPEAETGVLAVMTVAQISADGLAPDLATVRQVKSEPVDDLLRPRDITEVKLPIGSALRVHEVFREPPDGFGERLTEAVSYFVSLPEAPALIDLRLQWSDFALGDQFLEHAAVTADSLEYVAL